MQILHCRGGRSLDKRRLFESRRLLDHRHNFNIYT